MSHKEQLICKITQKHDMVEELARDFPILCMFGMVIGTYIAVVLAWILHPIRMIKYIKQSR